MSLSFIPCDKAYLNTYHWTHAMESFKLNCKHLVWCLLWQWVWHKALVNYMYEYLLSKCVSGNRAFLWDIAKSLSVKSTYNVWKGGIWVLDNPLEGPEEGKCIVNCYCFWWICGIGIRQTLRECLLLHLWLVGRVPCASLEPSFPWLFIRLHW